MKSFRLWLQEQWYEHLEEISAWQKHEPEYTLKEYFEKYKWWLRREYRFQAKSK
jgi:hypothetical protein